MAREELVMNLEIDDLLRKAQELLEECSLHNKKNDDARLKLGEALGGAKWCLSRARELMMKRAA
jgi:hypothetical protein